MSPSPPVTQLDSQHAFTIQDQASAPSSSSPSLLSLHLADSKPHLASTQGRNMVDDAATVHSKATLQLQNSILEAGFHAKQGMRIVLDCSRYHASHFKGKACDWCFQPSSEQSTEMIPEFKCPNGCRVHFCSYTCIAQCYRKVMPHRRK